MPFRTVFRLAAVSAALMVSALAATIDVDVCDTLPTPTCTFDAETSTVTVLQFGVTAEDHSPSLLLSSLREHIVIRDVEWNWAAVDVRIAGPDNRTGGMMPAGHTITIQNASIKKITVTDGAVAGGIVRVLSSDVELRVASPLTSGSRVEVRGTRDGAPRFMEVEVKILEESSVVIEDVLVHNELLFADTMKRSRVTISRCTVLLNDIEFAAPLLDTTIVIDHVIARRVKITPKDGLIRGGTVEIVGTRVSDYFRIYPLTDGGSLLLDSCEFGGRGFDYSGRALWDGGHAQICRSPLEMLAKYNEPSSVFGNSSVVIRDSLFDIVAVYVVTEMAPILLSAPMAMDATITAVNVTVKIRQGPVAGGVVGPDLHKALVIFTAAFNGTLDARRIHAPGLTALFLNHTADRTISPESKVNVCAFSQPLTAETTAASAFRMSAATAPATMTAAFTDLPDIVCSCGAETDALCLGSSPIIAPAAAVASSGTPTVVRLVAAAIASLLVPLFSAAL